MNQKVMIILAIVGGISVMYSLRNCSSKTPRYNWDETYADEKEDVYGTYVIKRFLENISSNERSDIDIKLSKYFEEKDNAIGSYMFVGEAMKVDDSDAEALAKFVENGNHALIATQVFPNTLSTLIFKPCREKPDKEKGEFKDSIEEGLIIEDNEDADDADEYYYEEEFNEDDTLNIELDEYNYEESIPYNSWTYKDYDHIDYIGKGFKQVVLNTNSQQTAFVNTDTIYKTRRNADPYYRTWRYLHDSLACMANNDMEVLGYLNDSLINFFEIPYGHGSFLIHTIPMAFTNANMLNDTTAQYVMDITNKAASDTWHWDDYSRTNRQSGMRRNGNRTKLSNKGPLTYLLRQEPLAWAWYSLLSMGLLFMVFKAKRKQRVIPVLEENENTSLAFINTIGSLYFRKNDHKQLCKDQMQLWLEEVREQYRMNTSKLDEDFINKLSAKTKVKPSEIKSLIDYYNNIENSNFVSENTMIQFYQKLNQFAIQSN